mgnify:CR=1 FL=1
MAPIKIKKANNIISHLKIPAAHNSLQRTYWTGSDSSWTGITVESRYADIFLIFPCKFFLLQSLIHGCLSKMPTLPECHGALHHLLYLFFSYLFFPEPFSYPIPIHSIQILIALVNTTAISPRKNTKRHHQQSNHCQTKSCPFGVQGCIRPRHHFILHYFHINYFP